LAAGVEQGEKEREGVRKKGRGKSAKLRLKPLIYDFYSHLRSKL
jgi:hypothetical protein